MDGYLSYLTALGHSRSSQSPSPSHSASTSATTSTHKRKLPPEDHEPPFPPSFSNTRDDPLTSNDDLESDSIRGANSDSDDEPEEVVNDEEEYGHFMCNFTASRLENCNTGGPVTRNAKIKAKSSVKVESFDAKEASDNVVVASTTQSCTSFIPLLPIILPLLNLSECEVAVWPLHFDLELQPFKGLGNVAGDSPKCRDLVLSNRALTSLGKPQPPFEQVKPALPALERLVHSDDEEILLVKALGKMVRRRIIVHHSGRWERSEYVDGDEQLVTMSSDKLCFSSLVREVHKLLRTDPNMIEYELFYLTSTNTGRRIRASLQDDGDLLDLLHEQTTELVVYVISRQLEGSRVGPSMRDDYVLYFSHAETHGPTAEEGGEGEEEAEGEEEGEEEEQEQEEVNDRTRLVESLLTEFSGWLRSSADRTDRLLCLTGVVPPSTTGVPFRSDGPSSNWVVPLADWDIAGPLSWDEGQAPDLDSLHQGAIFQTKEDLALAVGIYHMQNRVEYAVYRSNRSRLGYVCKHGGDCPFKCFAVADGHMWRIYKFNGTHTCHLDMGRIAPRQVPARVLRKYFACRLVDEQVVLKPKEMMAELVREFGIHIDYSFALRTRNIAIQMVYGDFDKSYAQLPAFLHTLQLMNPGTVVDMEITSDGRFKHSFLALGACVSAFLQYARPVLVIDGTHLKGKNKGVLFVAVTKDGNEQILPVAVGLGPIENDECWIWFLAHLHMALGDIDDLLIVSDQHQSIKNAVEAVFPRATHGLCYYHLKNKMMKRGKHVTTLFQEAAYAYRRDTFRESMSTLEQWFVERRAAAQSSNHMLTDGIALKLSGNVDKGRCYAVRPTTLATLWKVEVGREVYMVDLQNRTCDCREFELDLIPCSHAAVVICCTGAAIYDYVDMCYKAESLVGMYNSVIRGLPHPEQWIMPDAFGARVVLAPDIRRRAGRPSTSRARAPFEASSSARRQFCTRCHRQGHNRRVCTSHLPIGGVDLNSPPEDVPRRRAPKKCSICGSTEHTCPTCPIRLSVDEH
ncbi:hypothetical protein C2S52_014037 [Perilla frutescens var. hirtella]|nr:hypothetical protein C2S52_014037 [Perilla frutescens var. hirtella]